MHLTIRSGATATVFIDRRLSSIDDYSAVYNLSVRNLNKKTVLAVWYESEVCYHDTT